MNPEAADVDGVGFELDWEEFALAAAASAELYSDRPLLRIEVRVRRPENKTKDYNYKSTNVSNLLCTFSLELNLWVATHHPGERLNS